MVQFYNLLQTNNKEITNKKENKIWNQFKFFSFSSSI